MLVQIKNPTNKLVSSYGSKNFTNVKFYKVNKVTPGPGQNTTRLGNNKIIVLQLHTHNLNVLDALGWCVHQISLPLWPKPGL
jgi:hypothetical protein